MNLAHLHLLTGHPLSVAQTDTQAALIATRVLIPLADITDPFQMIACTVLPWIAWVIVLGGLFIAAKLGLRAVSTRAGDDVLMAVGCLAGALIIAGLVTNPTAMAAIATKFGASALTFTACPTGG